MAAGIQIPETLCRELSQSRRVPRGLHGFHWKADRRRGQTEMAAYRRLLVSARRHSDRRVLADRQAAKGNLGSRSGRPALSRTRVKTEIDISGRDRSAADAIAEHGARRQIPEQEQ